jgi:hypothetical protein
MDWLLLIIAILGAAFLLFFGTVAAALIIGIKAHYRQQRNFDE